LSARIISSAYFNDTISVIDQKMSDNTPKT
jgi:hypothetical protein